MLFTHQKHDADMSERVSVPKICFRFDASIRKNVVDSGLVSSVQSRLSMRHILSKCYVLFSLSADSSPRQKNAVKQNWRRKINLKCTNLNENHYIDIFVNSVIFLSPSLLRSIVVIRVRFPFVQRSIIHSVNKKIECIYMAANAIKVIHFTAHLALYQRRDCYANKSYGF